MRPGSPKERRSGVLPGSRLKNAMAAGMLRVSDKRRDVIYEVGYEQQRAIFRVFLILSCRLARETHEPFLWPKTHIPS
jgi:hypothetical protein